MGLGCLSSLITGSAAPSDMELQSALTAASSDMELQFALTDQSKLLQGLLARVGSFLERMEVALGKISLVPTMFPTAPKSRPPVVFRCWFH